MSYEDDITRMLRYFRRRMEELEELALSMIRGTLEYPSPGDIAYKAERLSDGVLEPLITFHDEGDYLVVAINLAGAREDSVEVKVYGDRVEVRASLNEETVRRALGGLYWSRNIREYRGVYRLPSYVDPSTATKEMRSGILLIRVRKLGGAPGR
ncbi:MAG: Hsp20/alpha crystallin family protein [Desulfurococcales archaeon]|nr:Hsp20/alpha crystallin family protein [Desulfurococcales archaeon]